MKFLSLTALFLIILALGVLGPMLTIWSLNTLFHFGIPINLATWFSVVWLCVLFKTHVVRKIR